MSTDRSSRRNVHFYDASKPASDALGGLIQNGSVTEANFLHMLGILLAVPAPIYVRHRTSGTIIATTNNPLLIGSYDIYCDAVIKLTEEPWIYRINSSNISGHPDPFRDGIRARDGRCVISGVINPRARITWATFDAAHIFPLGAASLWTESDHGRLVTGIDDTIDITKINSCQNGLMLRKHIHGLFDQYLISVNPDDNYKITVFDDDLDSLDGRILDPICRNPADPNPVSDDLLRWHFRQSVLANMRGVGEPIFESDFPTGIDMVEEIRLGPYAQERLESELASRLRLV
ncbi:HNH endonuclease-domain-containing protein [Tuber borchii]|uniref:HNH endonuclease-domain-containing protein n=1 Tax=Tuber borchii TaxID=42251 RepID=A0A2T7A4L0_TUBBO|nr:HNH endonuclease-domain-containing protein [Tuber borchii]